MGRIKKNVLKYGKKELNSSVSVFLDLTEPKRNETTEIPKFTEIVLFRSSTAGMIRQCISLRKYKYPKEISRNVNCIVGISFKKEF